MTYILHKLHDELVAAGVPVITVVTEEATVIWDSSGLDPLEITAIETVIAQTKAAHDATDYRALARNRLKAKYMSTLRATTEAAGMPALAAEVGLLWEVVSDLALALDVELGDYIVSTGE